MAIVLYFRHAYLLHSVREDFPLVSRFFWESYVCLPKKWFSLCFSHWENLHFKKDHRSYLFAGLTVHWAFETTHLDPWEVFVVSSLKIFFDKWHADLVFFHRYHCCFSTFGIWFLISFFFPSSFRIPVIYNPFLINLSNFKNYKK